MNDEKMRELIMDYLEGNLTGELKEFVANHIQKTEKWRTQYEQYKVLEDLIENNTQLETPIGMKAEFESLLLTLEEEVEEDNSDGKVVSINRSKVWLQIAASFILVVAAAFAGYKFSNVNNQEELAQLREEMEATKELVLISLENQSASSRLNAVNVSNKISVKDDEIIGALINTMNTDINANVRLAAMDALSNFADDNDVRSALIESLSIQDKPVVQIALINLLVGLKEEGARDVLTNIASDEAIENSVRDEANYGLYRL